MSVPLAYLLTWRTYGTWLPGDERGCVDPLHNTFGTPYAPPNEHRHDIAESAMTGPPYELNDETRAMVNGTIGDHCAIKHWGLHAVNARTNHVHVVVSCGGFDPDMAISQFKSWCTRRLRANRFAGEEADIWARRGSTRYIWDEEELSKAVDYVLNCQ